MKVITVGSDVHHMVFTVGQKSCMVGHV